MKLEVKFLNDSGTETLVTFDRDTGTATTATGQRYTYTRPDGGRTLDLKGPENFTITFDRDIQMEAGHQLGYSSSDGRKGTATIVRVE